MRPGIPFQVYQPGAAQVPGHVIFGEDDPFLARSSDIVTVRRNKITLCGWHGIEAGQVAAASERLRIDENVIRDSKTAGIFLVNVHGALVRGNTFESVTRHFAPTDAYQSLRTEHCTDVRVSDEVLKDARLKK